MLIFRPVGAMPFEGPRVRCAIREAHDHDVVNGKRLLDVMPKIGKRLIDAVNERDRLIAIQLDAAEAEAKARRHQCFACGEIVIVECFDESPGDLLVPFDRARRKCLGH